MKVIARAGVRVPHEDAPRRYITDDRAVDVPESFYYLRRVAERDLLIPDNTIAASDADESTKGAE